jgi:hypothetical protein
MNERKVFNFFLNTVYGGNGRTRSRRRAVLFEKLKREPEPHET